MKNSEIFLRTTEKLYNEINSRKKRNGLTGTPNPSELDILVEKEAFENDEWEFLLRNVNKFKFAFLIPYSEPKWFPVYKIESKNLSSNELNVLGIRSKFHE